MRRVPMHQLSHESPVGDDKRITRRITVSYALTQAGALLAGQVVAGEPLRGLASSGDLAAQINLLGGRQLLNLTNSIKHTSESPWRITS